MKFMIAVGLLGLSLSAHAEKVDYKYCRDTFTPSFGGYGPGSDDLKGYPFVIKDDGKIVPHKSANYKYDLEEGTETLEFDIKMGSFYGGTPSKDSDKTIGKTIITIKRDKKGNIIQVSNASKNFGAKTESGVGRKNPWAMPGGGMYGPGIGVGFPGGGFGMGGYPTGPSEFTTVTDVKIKSGKCFPYRTVSMNTMNNHTHHSFISDVKLCRDLRDFYKKQDDKDSKLGKLKACYDSYQKEAQKIIDGHLKRNDDLYNPKSEEEALDAWGSGGYFGQLEGGSFSNGTADVKGGYGGYGPGGFGMSIDTVVENPQFNSAEKVKMLAMQCGFPYGSMKDMVADDDLFKKEIQATAGGEGSGGGATKEQ